ncbi:hypothetical protein F4781DRAFT_202078 [Annulohypoxylon bovei var. microspora]|nr:hypothetical protein F4781DRAFT_202078 [Annulohypoxylon bovei var. microspora]
MYMLGLFHASSVVKLLPVSSLLVEWSSTRAMDGRIVTLRFSWAVLTLRLPLSISGYQILSNHCIINNTTTSNVAFFPFVELSTLW